MRSSVLQTSTLKLHSSLFLRVHLCCNFCGKVFLFLLDTFAYFETNYFLDSKSTVYRFKICCNSLFSVFCFYISLI